MKTKHKEGDVFVIPTRDGRLAICQVICALKGNLRNCFSFGVLSIQIEEGIPNTTKFLTFSNSRGDFNVIFGASKNITDSQWKIIGNLPLTDDKESMKYFRVAANVYKCDEYIGNFSKDEYMSFPVLGVAGNELIQEYLAQH